MTTTSRPIEDQLSDYTRALFQRIDKTVEIELGQTGLREEKTSKNILKQGKHYANGDLMDSIKSMVEKTASGFSQEFGAGAKSSSGYPYGAIVEFGRPAGSTPPPVSNILDWLKRKIHLGHMEVEDDDDAYLSWVAFQISQKIGAKGTKPFPFLQPSFESNSKNFENEITKKINNCITAG